MDRLTMLRRGHGRRRSLAHLRINLKRETRSRALVAGRRRRAEPVVDDVALAASRATPLIQHHVCLQQRYDMDKERDVIF
jgi:hypothetical protein